MANCKKLGHKVMLSYKLISMEPAKGHTEKKFPISYARESISWERDSKFFHDPSRALLSCATRCCLVRTRQEIFSACPFGGSVHLSLNLIALNAAINLRAKLASEKLHCADSVHNPTKITGHDVKSRAIYQYRGHRFRNKSGLGLVSGCRVRLRNRVSVRVTLWFGDRVSVQGQFQAQGQCQGPWY